MNGEISEKTIAALKVIASSDGITPGRFAALAWPDNPHHSRVYNSGRGAVSGRGLVRSAGGYLGRLYKAGLVRRSIHGGGWLYYISSAGQKAIDEACK